MVCVGYSIGLIIDAAHCNQLPYRSLTNTQAHVLAGGHSGKMNCLWPLDSLTHQKVRRELATRKLDSEGNSKEVRYWPAEHLGGLQHVPLLLVSNPRENTKALHLDHYSFNEFVPLHALKGHLTNLFAELPFFLLPSLKQEVDQVLAVCLRKQITGADLLATAIVASR